jgi:tRNA U34 5-methylaminomethyl-2-thiouridine-forming methyltransferase MnmC
MPSINTNEDDAKLSGLLSGSALWSMAAAQTRISLETQTAFLKSYEVVFTSWLQHRQQDVEDGLRTCEIISANPDALNVVATYQQWASACVNRWSEDIKVLRENFVNLASRVQEVSQEAVTMVEASQGTARTEAAKRAAR